jgi:hypothetical protein
MTSLSVFEMLNPAGVLELAQTIKPGV